MLEQRFVAKDIVTEIESKEKFSAIHELINKNGVFKKIKNLSDFEKIVIQREKQQSTGLGKGIAVAHGKCNLTDKVVFALGLSKEGIDFKAQDKKPVNFLFLIASPVNKDVEYLECLSVLIKVVRNKVFDEELLSCSNLKKAGKLFMKELRHLEKMAC